MPDHRFLWLLAIFGLTAAAVVGFLIVTNHADDFGANPTPKARTITEAPTATPTPLVSTQYQNPFEDAAAVAEYSNPFDNYQNPFDTVQ